MTEFGKSDLLPLQVFQELGYAGVLFPVTLFRIAMKAVEQALSRIASEGTQQSLLGQMQTRQQLYDLLRYSDYEARDRAFFEGDVKQ